MYDFVTGFRGVVTLYNKLNYPAEFTWAPNLGEKGTAFSIRPATGRKERQRCCSECLLFIKSSQLSWLVCWLILCLMSH